MRHEYSGWDAQKRNGGAAYCDHGSRAINIDNIGASFAVICSVYRSGMSGKSTILRMPEQAANLRVDYAVLDGIEIGVGARNMFDDNYTLTNGFPEPGRSLFASIRARY